MISYYSYGVKAKAWISLALLLPVPSLGVLFAMRWYPDTAIGVGAWMFSKAWILLLPLFWHVVVERQKIKVSKPGPGLGAGAVSGLVIMAIIFAAYFFFARHIIDFERMKAMAAEVGLDSLSRYLLGVLYWCTLNSILEEYVWRWFVFRQFEKVIGGKAAVVASGFGFTVHHFFALTLYFGLGLNLFACLGIFIGGTLWSVLYLRYRSIWPAYLSHAIVDVAVFVVGYVLFFT